MIKLVAFLVGFKVFGVDLPLCVIPLMVELSISLP